MKKMFVILSVVFSMVLCSCGNNNEKEEYNRRLNNMSYIEFDGHEYVRYHNYNQGSITHSPKCPCLKIYKK